MSTLHLSDSLLDGYVALFDQLGPKDQAILLEKLVKSTKKHQSEPNDSIDDVFGVWDFDEPADETVRRIRNARCFDRSREAL